MIVLSLSCDRRLTPSNMVRGRYGYRHWKRLHATDKYSATDKPSVPYQGLASAGRSPHASPLPCPPARRCASAVFALVKTMFGEQHMLHVLLSRCLYLIDDYSTLECSYMYMY